MSKESKEKMRITLIYPGFKEDASGLSEPLGILYIASVLKKEGHKVDFIDMTFNTDQNIIEKIVKNSDLVGMSCTSLLFDRVIKFVRDIKELNKDMPCFLGGSHGTINPEDVLKEGFDYVIIGEGENTVKNLADALSGKIDIESIDGLAFKKEDKVVIKSKMDFIDNLDSLPFPARELWDYESYFKTGTTEIGIIATRGCPYNCLYCKPMIDKLFGNKVRKRSAKNVVEEIEKIDIGYKGLFKGKVKLWFKDDTLTLCGVSWFREFKKELAERELEIDWGCHTRVDNVDFELLMTMKEAGLSHISFGVESGSQKILNYYRKGTTVEQAVKAFEICRKLGIQTFAYFMVGAPVETREDLEMTYKLIKKIKPDGLDVYTTVPYPGNDLYDLLKDNKQLREQDNIDYYTKNSMIKLQYLTDMDLNEYRRKIYRLNNRQLMLRYFKSFENFKKLIKYIINRPGFVINYLRRSL
ncbi:MAG: radical SAM protein [Nanoarchaeota archaeon]|nr:radical SAM protein [Nanoarchaeota archaeon]